MIVQPLVFHRRRYTGGFHLCEEHVVHSPLAVEAEPVVHGRVEVALARPGQVPGVPVAALDGHHVRCFDGLDFHNDILDFLALLPPAEEGEDGHARAEQEPCGGLGDGGCRSDEPNAFRLV